MKLQKSTQPSTKHREFESIICRQSFREIISHMRDQRQDAAMDGRPLVLPRTTFVPDQMEALPGRVGVLVLEDHRLYTDTPPKSSGYRETMGRTQ
jgi:hypothetical protein